MRIQHIQCTYYYGKSIISLNVISLKNAEFSFKSYFLNVLGLLQIHTIIVLDVSFL